MKVVFFVLFSLSSINLLAAEEMFAIGLTDSTQNPCTFRYRPVMNQDGKLSLNGNFSMNSVVLNSVQTIQNAAAIMEQIDRVVPEMYQYAFISAPGSRGPFLVTYTDSELGAIGTFVLVNGPNRGELIINDHCTYVEFGRK